VKTVEGKNKTPTEEEEIIEQISNGELNH